MTYFGKLFWSNFTAYSRR